MLSLLLAAMLGQASLDALSTERVMIRDARAIIATQGERVWPGFAKAPFEIDVVEATREFLFCRHPQSTFAPGGVDPMSGCSIQTRPRELPVDLAASGDHLPGGAVIVMGTRKALGVNRADYILTLIHEDFHQFQSVHPTFNAAVARIRPARSSAEWMLDYPFPYTGDYTAAAFRRMNKAASSFLNAKSQHEREAEIAAYVRARHEAQATMPAADWSYYEFQIGKEGVARWTEIAVGQAVRKADVAAAARERRQGLQTSLTAMDRQGLAVWKRSVFYVLGPIEIDMLTSLGQDWRTDYFSKPFAFGERLDAACKATVGCSGG